MRQLWEECFPDPSGFNAFFFQKLYRPAFTLLLEKEGNLCAMTQRLPCHLRLMEEDGTPLGVDATYIYGACTAPPCRRRGYMDTLLHETFVADQRDERAASLLIPAEPWLFAFYRLFGYESFFTVEQHTILSCADSPPNNNERKQREDQEERKERKMPRRLTVDDIPALSARYEALPSPCLMCRTATDWAALLRLFDTLGKGAYGWFAAGQLTAYAFCWADNAQEAVGLTPQQEQELLHILGRDSLTYTTYTQQIPLATSLTIPRTRGNPSEGNPSDRQSADTGKGTIQSLGCIKWYPRESLRSVRQLPTVSAGYMNLMLN